jgi:AcrR family transcriptional regulator
MNRREASKKETRRLILTVARKLFAQKGMEECTIRDIAKKAGVSPASVVVHFKSKTALFEEVLSRDIGNALSELITSMPKNLEFPDPLMHLAKGMLRFYDKNRNLYRALLRHTIFEPTSETPNISKQSEEYVQFLFRLMEEQKTRRMIRSEVDSTVAAASIFFLYLGALTMLFRMPEMTVETIADLLASMTNQYLKGIYAGKKRA